MATKDQLVARAMASEADRNEVFLESQELREETFREWLANKDITVPDDNTMTVINAKLNVHESEIDELQVHNHDNQYANIVNEHTHSNKETLDEITPARIELWDNKSDFSGSYNDLANKPTIPSKVSDLSNDSGYISSIPDNYTTQEELDLLLQKKSDTTHSHEFDELTGMITRPNSTAGKISYTKTDGTIVDGVYLTASDNLRVGNQTTKTVIHSKETPDIVLPTNQAYELVHRGNLCEVPYITTNSLNIFDLKPGNYACVASRFANPPIPGDGGYVDVEVRENTNGDNEVNVRKTITVHYTYHNRTFIGQLHHTYGFRNWIEIEPMSDVQLFYQDEANRMYSKVNEFINENTKVIGFITDTHFDIAKSQNTTDTSISSYGHNGLYHTRNIVEIIGHGVGDMLIHGGDAIDGRDISNLNKELTIMNKELLKSPIPTFLCKGNHDDGTMYIDTLPNKQNTYQYYLNDVKWSQLVTNKYRLKYGIVGDVNNNAAAYGYYDFTDVKLRVIMLDVHDFRKQDMVVSGTNDVNIDTTTFIVGQKQIDWLTTTALKLPESSGWKVMVFSHIGWYNPSDINSSRVRNGYQVHGALKAFNNHESYNADNTDNEYGTIISCDFTGTNHKVVATICGHNHNDNAFSKEGIQYIYCGCSAPRVTLDENDNPLTEREWYGEKEDLWTTFVVDTKQNKLHLIRFGAEKDFEQTFDF